ncbi:hypothetical protein DFH06DRAFT_284367 [Mycena polygramma]|nr:hypothetical protein DFH06DRAFT_284367 [Mycena polygramma]
MVPQLLGLILLLQSWALFCDATGRASTSSTVLTARIPGHSSLASIRRSYSRRAPRGCYESRISYGVLGLVNLYPCACANFLLPKFPSRRWLRAESTQIPCPRPLDFFLGPSAILVSGRALWYVARGLMKRSAPCFGPPQLLGVTGALDRRRWVSSQAVLP